MDLLSTVRKSGSRGGVNFSWDEVANSSHRENYLGHSLKAPVGRWAKGRDLGWYAKADSTNANPDETDEQRADRERKEEMRKIKEAEEDAMAKALGLPAPQRDTSGANAIEVGGMRQLGAVAETTVEEKAAPSTKQERSRRHGDSRKGERRRHRSRSGSRNRNRRRERHERERDGERRGRDSTSNREPRDERRSRRERSRSRDRGSQEGRRRDEGRNMSRERRRRSYSPSSRRR